MADREYREGKAQNHLRPEDIDKIVNTYRRGEDVPAYARKVPRAEIAAEDYNCNIRRYVDNAPPPEPHDVRAHLLGGIPKTEVKAKKKCIPGDALCRYHASRSQAYRVFFAACERFPFSPSRVQRFHCPQAVWVCSNHLYCTPRIGGPTRDRTWDLPVMSRWLYQLSYGPWSALIDRPRNSLVYCFGSDVASVEAPSPRSAGFSPG